MMNHDIMSLLCGEASVAEKRHAIESVTPDCITGAFLADCAQYLLERALPLDLDGFDVCGTGGDAGAIKTFNVSTAVAFVTAAAGMPVIKHGNRAISSQSGSSDVLGALNVSVCSTPEEAYAQFNRHRLCFVAAPAFHPVLGKIADVRRSIGKPTFLNLLGPLCNPARTKRQLIGVFHAGFLKPVAEAARLLGKTDALAVHSDDGLDEISISKPTQACLLKNGKVVRLDLQPENAGVMRADLKKLRGGSAADNAAIIEKVFSTYTDSPATDIIAVNAAAAFMIYGLDRNLAQGVARAREVLSSGAAYQKLKDMRN